MWTSKIEIRSKMGKCAFGVEHADKGVSSDSYSTFDEILAPIWDESNYGRTFHRGSSIRVHAQALIFSWSSCPEDQTSILSIKLDAMMVFILKVVIFDAEKSDRCGVWQRVFTRFVELVEVWVDFVSSPSSFIYLELFADLSDGQDSQWSLDYE